MAKNPNRICIRCGHKWSFPYRGVTQTIVCPKCGQRMPFTFKITCTILCNAKELLEKGEVYASIILACTGFENYLNVLLRKKLHRTLDRKDLDKFIHKSNIEKKLEKLNELMGDKETIKTNKKLYDKYMACKCLRNRVIHTDNRPIKSWGDEWIKPLTALKPADARKVYDTICQMIDSIEQWVEDKKVRQNF